MLLPDDVCKNGDTNRQKRDILEANPTTTTTVNGILEEPELACVDIRSHRQARPDCKDCLHSFFTRHRYVTSVQKVLTSLEILKENNDKIQRQKIRIL